jgi:hypothetical protein
MSIRFGLKIRCDSGSEDRTSPVEHQTSPVNLSRVWCWLNLSGPSD